MFCNLNTSKQTHKQ